MLHNLKISFTLYYFYENVVKRFLYYAHAFSQQEDDLANKIKKSQ